MGKKSNEISSVAFEVKRALCILRAFVKSFHREEHPVATMDDQTFHPPNK
jgi:hypothetical protein